MCVYIYDVNVYLGFAFFVCGFGVFIVLVCLCLCYFVLGNMCLPFMCP